MYFEILNKTQQQMSQIEKAMAGEYKNADFMLEITESDSPFSPMEAENTDTASQVLADSEDNCHSLDQVFNSVLMKRLASLRNK
ncbi:hypothetical protein [Thalassomonas actiniarum]|uniref:Uncharacterized protein n=1 Tax=Thalassomonas actiniarum TaxID=485447 RepID=A0AAF0C5K4_9GAMM|nr:hypothetical protein [Thalassomonas actiniarum]WDE01094.1 hypothetical protein SG35_010920 [Thalassomonas actiniarum]